MTKTMDKKMTIFVLINARANGNIFRVKRSHISLRCVFLNYSVHRCISVVSISQYFLKDQFEDFLYC